MDNLTVTAVVADGSTFLVRLVGGFGAFHTDSGVRVEIVPGDSDATIEEVWFTIGLPAVSEQLVATVVEMLDMWWTQMTPLRFCAAPGKLAVTRRTAEQRFLPLPSNI